MLKFLSGIPACPEIADPSQTRRSELVHLAQLSQWSTVTLLGVGLAYNFFKVFTFFFLIRLRALIFSSPEYANTESIFSPNYQEKVGCESRRCGPCHLCLMLPMKVDSTVRPWPLRFGHGVTGVAGEEMECFQPWHWLRFYPPGWCLASRCLRPTICMGPTEEFLLWSGGHIFVGESSDTFRLA